MANKRIQMKRYNGSAWDNIYPIINTEAVGDSGTPIYLPDSGKPTACTVKSLTDAQATDDAGGGWTPSNTSTALINEKDLYYAMPKFNGVRASGTQTFYVPTVQLTWPAANSTVASTADISAAITTVLNTAV